jgi:hypothetical protein
LEYDGLLRFDSAREVRRVRETVVVQAAFADGDDPPRGGVLTEHREKIVGRFVGIRGVYANCGEDALVLRSECDSARASIH